MNADIVELEQPRPAISMIDWVTSMRRSSVAKLKLNRIEKLWRVSREQSPLEEQWNSWHCQFMSHWVQTTTEYLYPHVNNNNIYIFIKSQNKIDDAKPGSVMHIMIIQKMVKGMKYSVKYVFMKFKLGYILVWFCFDSCYWRLIYNTDCRKTRDKYYIALIEIFHPGDCVWN